MVWSSAFTDANGLRLHYTRTGGDGPPLVLLHGFSDDGRCWTPVAGALAPRYDVIMPDARGHGRSDGPEISYGNLEQAEDLAALIQALGLERPLLLGHSMGAVTAVALAGLYPDVPRAILLEDPPALLRGLPPGAPESREWQARMRAWIIELKRLLPEELVARQRAETPGWPDAELRPWAESKLRLSFNVLDNRPVPAIDWPALLRRIICPALLIAGDPACGALIAPEDAAALQAHLPHLRVTSIPAAGHSIRRDQPEAYLAVVRAFLEEIAPSGSAPMAPAPRG